MPWIRRGSETRALTIVLWMRVENCSDNIVVLPTHTTATFRAHFSKIVQTMIDGKDCGAVM